MKKSPILLKYGAIDAAFHFLKITLFATVLILLDRVSVSVSGRPSVCLSELCSVIFLETFDFSGG